MFVRLSDFGAKVSNPRITSRDSSSANRFAGDRKALLLRWSPYSDWYAN